MDEKKDERFSNIWKDPRFKPVSKKERKVQIDKRFESMFTDENFKMKFVDKRGRSIQETSTENLKKFYELTSSSDEEEEEEDNDNSKTGKTNEESVTSKPKVFPFDGAESGSTTSEESELEVDSEFDHKWGELHTDAPEIEKPTSRIAVCNMDWDRIKADDLLVLLNSFKPPDGIIQSVKIYPSEFGIQRMKEEEINGPKELTEKVLQSDEDDDTNTEEGAAYHREKLRKYQLSRLKYYFAIVECDSSETASVIYKELDGMEYESSAVTVDLRFVPDDMTFEQEPSSVATSLPSTYKPSLFTTTALQQIKVQLTWDETDPRRLEAMQNAFAKGKEANPQDVDLSAFLASSSDDENEDIQENTAKIEEIEDNISKKKKVEKYKELLQDLGNNNDKETDPVELEITWEPGLQKAAKDLVKTKQKEEQLTPWEQYLHKRKDKKKKKQKEKSSQLQQDSENSEFCEDEISSTRKDSSADEEKDNKDAEMLGLLLDKDVTIEDKKNNKLKKRRKEKLRKTKEQKNFNVDVADPRFSALYTSHLFNIEPADPHFRDTEGMKAFLKEKQRQRKKKKNTSEEFTKISKDTANLVTSIKQKTSLSKKRKL